jgi:hypothetical protein
MVLAHFGVAVFIVGVTMVSGFETETDVRMEIGDTASVAGYTFRLEAVTHIRGPNYNASRATVTAFYILCLNVVGLGIGITGAGWAIDQFREAGTAQPYTASVLVFTAISALAIPAFVLAGRWTKRDVARNAGG